MNSSNEYDAIIIAPEKLMIRQATLVSLTYPSFDNENLVKRHLIRCTNSWRGQGERHDFVFFQNKIAGTKAASDAFGGKAVGKASCLFEWDDVYGCSSAKRHSLALIDIFLPMRRSIGQKSASGDDIAHLKHHGMFLLEEQNQRGDDRFLTYHVYIELHMLF